MNQTLNDSLAEDLSALEEKRGGSFYVQVQGINVPFVFFRGEKSVLPTASAAKLFILCELFHQAQLGKLDLDTLIECREEYARPGDGVLKAMRGNQKWSLYNLAVLMMTISDNIATQAVLDNVGGSNVTAFMQSLGLQYTFVPENWPGGKAAENDVEPASSAEDLCNLAAMIARKELISPEISLEIIRIMRFNRCTDMLPRYIPVGEDHLAVSEQWIAHKNGYGVCRVEVGIVRLYDVEFALGLFFQPRLPVNADYKCLADYPPVSAMAEACRMICEYAAAARVGGEI